MYALHRPFRAPHHQTPLPPFPSQPGQETAAAFLETRRYAALRGATVEWSKGEGMVFDAPTRTLYLAMSQVR